MATTTTADRQSLAVFLSSQKGDTAEKILGAWTDHIADGVGTESALTAKRIADLTGLSRSTVNATLNKLAQNGGVIRFDQDKVSTWSLTPTRKAAIKRAAKKAAAQSAAKPNKRAGTLNLRTGNVTTARSAARTTKGSTVTDTNEGDARTDTGRRRKGAIDNEIRAYFEQNDNTPAGSYAVAKAIGSSAGAAYVALRRMDKDGKAALVSTEPDRYNINFDSDAWNTDESE